MISPTIELGDHVIVYASRDQMDSIILTKGHQFQSKFGHYKHDSMVGVLYGSKFSSSNGRGFVYLLRPTPELWTLALPHRTQILYLPDIAFITSYLDIKAGSKVVEAGTGSGSFSHAIARSVGSTGSIHSFEYHEERYKKARDEFELHGLAEVITLKHRNVCKDGFELVDEVDSLFLDVPAPWDAIPHAQISLRKDRQSRICCFSPCIEQVLKTVSSLSEHGFSDITTYETLSRTHDVTQLICPDVSTAIDRIVEVESKKERRRDTQIGDAKKKRDEKRELRDAAYKATLAAAEAKALPTAANGAEDAVEVKQEEEGPERKKVKLEDEAAVPILEGTDPWDMLPKEELDVEMDTAIIDPPVPAVTIPIVTPSNSTSQRQTTATLPLAGIKKFTFKAGPQTRGHTSYLTFATLLPTAAPTTEVFEEAREALKPPMTKDVSAVNTDVHVDEVVDASSNV